jgi:hypothetical protein
VNRYALVFAALAAIAAFAALRMAGGDAWEPLALTAALALLASAARSPSKGRGPSLDEDGIRLRSAVAPVFIPYGSITRAEARQSIDYGAGMYSVSGARTVSGRYRNREFGTYSAHVTRKVQQVIVVFHSGGVFAYNLPTEEDTMLSYMSLKSRVRQEERRRKAEAARAERARKAASPPRAEPPGRRAPQPPPRLQAEGGGPQARPPAQPAEKPSDSQKRREGLFDALFDW